MGKKDEGEESAPDVRIAYVKERILSTFPKAGGAKFDKTFASEENLAVMDTWFESDEKF